MNQYLPTPSQTIGPYFAYSLAPEQYGYDYKSVAGSNMISPDSREPWVHIVGKVLDGQQQPVSDALVELFQADQHGHLRSAPIADSYECFSGFGRTGTGTDPYCCFHFVTVKPAPAGKLEAPSIGIVIFMRGLLKPLFTRMYFPEEDRRNLADPVLKAVPPFRRRTLIAKRTTNPAIREYAFNIIVQGEGETVFFDLYSV